ncbi:MAG: phytoene/squalene synthase family protein [Pseudoxanthomonas sp.]
MSDSAALDSFLDKWRRRWPEWEFVERFVPPSQRPVVLAWFALLQEFEDAMNVAGDALPADAKLGWWAQELRDWARRRSRHPLGRVLEPLAAPWQALADALPTWPLLREAPTDLATALSQALPAAAAMAAVEAALFPGAARVQDPQALAAQLLATRWLEVRREQLPQWRATLLAQWPARAGGARPRRLLAMLARQRLQGLAEDGRSIASPSPLRLVWNGWRAASGGA